MADTLAQNPQYLALLRSLGFEENTLQSGAAAQTALAQQRQALEAPHIQQQGVLARQQIAGNMEARGILGSGEYLDKDAQQRAEEQYQLGNLSQTTAEKVGGIQYDLASKIADLTRANSEHMLDLGQQSDYNSKLATAQAQYGQ